MKRRARLWNFAPLATSTGQTVPPGRVTVLHDAAHPSSLVFSQLRGGAPTALPACGSLASEPYRPDPLAGLQP